MERRKFERSALVSQVASMLFAMLIPDLRHHAATHHGLLTRADALAGMGRGRLERRVRCGSLEVVQPGVYRVAGSPETWRQRLLAAVYAGGPGAVASMRSAAELHGFEEYELGCVEITTPRRTRTRTRGVIAHQTTVLSTEHVTAVNEIPVTSVPRTLCDLTAIRPEWAVARAVDAALTRRLTTLRRLQRVFDELSGRGRRRCTVMRAILDARDPSVEPGESPRERAVAQLLIEAGLPAPVHQHTVRVEGRRYRLDLAYPMRRVAVEYDGWDAHRSRSAFDRDRLRQNELFLSGWRILRFTSATTPHELVASVRRALELATSDQRCAG